MAGINQARSLGLRGARDRASERVAPPSRTRRPPGILRGALTNVTLPGALRLKESQPQAGRRERGISPARRPGRVI